jgi:hypothetical protein
MTISSSSNNNNIIIMSLSSSSSSSSPSESFSSHPPLTLVLDADGALRGVDLRDLGVEPPPLVRLEDQAVAPLALHLAGQEKKKPHSVGDGLGLVSVAADDGTPSDLVLRTEIVCL